MEALLLPKIITAVDLGIKTLTLLFIIAMVVYLKGQDKYNNLKFETVDKKSDDAKAASAEAKIESGCAEEKSKYAVKISKQAIATANKTFKLSKKTHIEVSKISENVEYLNNSWKEFVEGKYGDKKNIDTDS